MVSPMHRVTQRFAHCCILEERATSNIGKEPSTSINRAGRATMRLSAAYSAYCNVLRRFARKAVAAHLGTATDLAPQELARLANLILQARRRDGPHDVGLAFSWLERCCRRRGRGTQSTFLLLAALLMRMNSGNAPRGPAFSLDDGAGGLGLCRCWSAGRVGAGRTPCLGAVAPSGERVDPVIALRGVADCRKGSATHMRNLPSVAGNREPNRRRAISGLWSSGGETKPTIAAGHGVAGRKRLGVGALLCAMFRLRQLAAPRVRSRWKCRRVVSQLGLRRPCAASKRPSVHANDLGVVRPVVLLPKEALSWPDDRLRVVLRHELTHVRRWDCLTQVLAQLVRACFWFHPLVWWAVSRIKAEQEQACDDAVLNAGANAADYAQHLLSVVARLPGSYFVAPVALAMSRARRLELRLVAILEQSRDRRSLSRSWLAAVVLATLGLLVPLGSIRFDLQARAMATTEEVSGSAAQAANSEPPKSLSEVRERVRKAFAGNVDEKLLTAGAIKGMVEALRDPYSEYLEPGKLQDLQRQTAGALTGVGVQIQLKDQQLVVVTPLEGSPALEAGLRPGDIIDAVDGQPVKGMELQAVVRKILGPAGTDVK